jgi:acyl-coenzyme A thioesterase PaaI-like protein
MADSVGERVRRTWERLHRIPGGKRLFSRMIGNMAPYSGSIGAVVDELRPGYARVVLADRRRVRNHLRSVHAIALANLGELATGLATMAALPADARGILTGLQMTYLKKARGTLSAECAVELEPGAERREVVVVGEIRDAAGEVVARCAATWLIGPA